jgi:hypothetical protein
MALGFVYMGVCHSSEQIAYYAYGSMLEPSISPTLAVTYDFLPAQPISTFIGSYAKTVTSYDGVGAIISQYQQLVQVPSFLPCDTAQAFNDGLTNKVRS